MVARGDARESACMGKPVVDRVEVVGSHRGSRASSARMAIHAAAGTMPSEKPSTAWEIHVNRLVKE